MWNLGVNIVGVKTTFWDGITGRSLDPETTEQILTMIDQGALKFADWIKQEWTGLNKNEHEKTRMNLKNKIEKIF